MSNVGIFTSIPPSLRRMVDGDEVGETYQAQCVDSWLASGSPVYSLNPAHEIAPLQRRFAGVTFVQAHDADEINPIPSLAELLALMREQRHSVNIFVNGDIRLNRSAESARFIVAQATDALLVVNRTNITQLQPATAIGMQGAFDVLGIPRFLLSEIPVDGYRLGQPWWDYWLPTCAVLSGRRVRRHSGQLAYHLKHENQWDDRTMVAQGRRFIAMIEPMLTQAGAADSSPAARTLAKLANQLLATRPRTGDEARWMYFLGARCAELLNFNPIIPAVSSP